LGIKIGHNIVKLPWDFAKLLAWKSIRLQEDISRTVGVQAVISKLKILTPKCAQRKLRELKNKIPKHKYMFILGQYRYTIATGDFGIIAYKSKIRKPVIPRKPTLKEKISKKYRVSKASLSSTFTKQNMKNAFHNLKPNFNNMFKHIRIPKKLKGYFHKLSMRDRTPKSN